MTTPRSILFARFDYARPEIPFPELRAQQKFMPSNTNLLEAVGGNPQDPQQRARLLFRAAKAELEKLQGRTLVYEELARYAGQASSTVFNRLHKARHPALEALLFWLERLPREVRNALVNQACRCFPNLNHPRLSHDPAQVSTLRALLRQSSGITIVRGENDGLRTFVVTALGHEVEMARGVAAVCGLDLHRPDWFVPLGQVNYLYDLPPAALQQALRVTLAQLSGKAGQLIVLNAVHPAAQVLLPAISPLTRKCHVVFAEDTLQQRINLPISETPVNLLTVSLRPQDRIQVLIQGDPL